MSEDHRKKISQAIKKAYREKCFEGYKGKHHSEEAKRKISEAHKGKHPKTEFKKGYIMSEETKRKIRLTISLLNKKGTKFSEETLFKKLQKQI